MKVIDLEKSILDLFILNSDFKVSYKITYGIYKRRFVSIKNTNGLIKISINIPRNVNLKTCDEISRQLYHLKEVCPSLEKNKYGTFSVDSYLNPLKTNDNEIITCIDKMVEILDNNSIDGCDTCPICNRNMASDAPLYIFEDSVLQAHHECFLPIKTMIDSAMQRPYGNIKKQHYYSGLFGIILAGFINAALLMFLFSWGYFSFVSTLITIFLAHFLYKKFNGKMVKTRHYIIYPVLFVFVLLGEYLGLAYSVFCDYNLPFLQALAHPFYQLDSYWPLIITTCLHFLILYGGLMFSINHKYNSYEEIKEIKEK